MELTGERTLPGIWHENYWFRRHEIAYARAGEFIGTTAPGAGVLLDAGCGEGYGAAVLADRTGARTIGVDYDGSALAGLPSRHPGVAAVHANLVDLAFAAESFDAVVCCQVIEHIWDQPRLLAECARVARPGGVVVVTTPNRLTFSPGLGRGEKPLNPFHINELDAEELAELMAIAGLESVSVEGVGHGPRLRAADERWVGGVVGAQLAAPYDRWAPELAALVPSITAADFVVTAADVDRSLDLFAVGRRGAIHA